MKKKSDRHKDSHFVRLPSALYELYRGMAKKNNRPLSWEVRAALVEYARQRKEAVPPGL